MAAKGGKPWARRGGLSQGVNERAQHKPMVPKGTPHRVIAPQSILAKLAPL
jgi:hypothetical protein